MSTPAYAYSPPHRSLRTLGCIVALAVVISAGAGCQSPNSVERPDAEASTMTSFEREQHLAAFDKVWSTVAEHHFDPDFGGVDWDAMRDQYRPLVAQAKSKREVRRAMQGMLDELGLSHFAIIPEDAVAFMDEASGETNADEESEANAESNTNEVPSDVDRGDDDDEPVDIAEDGDPGLDVRVLDGRAIVTQVDEDGAAAAAGIRPGFEIISVEDRVLAPMIQTTREGFSESSLLDFQLRRMVVGMLEGPEGEELSLFVRGADEEIREMTIVPRPSEAVTTFGGISQAVIVDSETLDSGVGYVTFNIFLGETLVPEVQQAIREFRDGEAPGIIIDLRGNPGGIGFFANFISGYLFEYDGDDDGGLELGTMTMRRGVGAMKFTIAPRIDAYRGYVAILIDSCSVSTSEIMAGGLADLGRARVFGTRSAGAALPSVIEKLPNGDAVQYVVANYVSASGATLEGIGVEPHVTVQLTREKLLEGSDPVIDAAVNWILEASKEDTEE